MKKISVVTPCYNEEENIAECYSVVKEIFEKHLGGYEREHVFCDNASTDRTLEILKGIVAEDVCARIIVNARNFGPLRNNYNGVMAATGDAILLFLPADLQDPPELLPEFVKLWEQGYEIVYGIRATREEGWLMRSVRGFYYNILTRFSEIQIPPGVGDFQLVDRRVVEAMRRIRDTYPFMRMMTFECGGRAVGIPYRWRARKRGFSKNRLSALFDQGMNGIISFTTAPLRFGLVAGFCAATFSLVYAIANFLIGIIFYHKVAEPGILTLIVASFFFGGVQLFFTGLIGEYVLAIYSRVREKPVVFERERINFTGTSTVVEPVTPDKALEG
ncbi:glycosyltransferase family 2 protein [Nitrospirillum iridis]|uniref:Glycosyltransferase involved in cell wall biosynthesis n=1 Tax=Nitrospirillum iridis TaxID=765888 RepID=A0A7X0EFW8_9PROT|nr:glycosyltransferase family 2 protein [Nitrospirillum iridis]MBB6252929.1 glycosyltransferase involved in cell wall biosynthesis [Nitrospirillum iridis]